MWLGCQSRLLCHASCTGANIHCMDACLVVWFCMTGHARGKVRAQVDAAFRHAMVEARKSEASVRDGLSFEQFMVMLRADSRDSLDQYDDRMGGSSHGGALQGSLTGVPRGTGIARWRHEAAMHARVKLLQCV